MRRTRSVPPVADLDSGASLAGLALRASLGATMIAHGWKHGSSLAGTAAWFESIGFRQPQLQARMSAVVEVGSGAALLIGFATPLSASAVIGTMGVAHRTVHLHNGFFITGEGWEYVGLISVAAAALAALGGGPFSVDRMLGVQTRGAPWQRAAMAVSLGTIGAAAQLATFWRKPAPAD